MRVVVVGGFLPDGLHRTASWRNVIKCEFVVIVGHVPLFFFEFYRSIEYP